MGKCRGFAGVVLSAAMLVVLSAGWAVAQGRPAAANRETRVDTMVNPAAETERDQVATQEQLIKLLRMSPTLTSVVVRDPSLLANQEYVSRNNPELARFLQSHPEIARNPDFYLFTNLNRGDGPPSEALERKVWPEIPREPEGSPVLKEFMGEVVPFLIFLCVAGVLMWLVHVLLENRRWGRIFRLQTEVHGKLMDRFTTSQELLSYMNSEVGTRFLEAAPITVGFERKQPVPSPVARVLTPLQIGTVMILLGAGLLFLRHSIPEAAAPLLVVGTVMLMPGLGFIISAGITWALARHLGLIPQNNGNPQ